jgi:hypothetical protein
MTFSLDAMMAHAQASAASAETSMSSRSQRFAGPLKAAQAQNPELGIFSHVSLEGWVLEAKAAGIPVVPAEVVARMPVDTLMNFEEPREKDEVHWKALANARRALASNDMLRWDCCASSEVKSVMNDGGQNLTRDWMKKPDLLNPAVPAWRSELSPDDPRFFDLAYEYPGDEIAVLKRPWIEARREGSHPAEYRVFVENNEIVGVANYYIQRDLPHNDHVHAEVVDSIALAQTLLDSMAKRSSVAFNGDPEKIPPQFEFGKVSCTLDFLVDHTGQVMFLEAGPPFGLGAHPCSFMKNKQGADGRISVHGVALGLGQEPQPIDAFMPQSKKPVPKPM